MDYTYKYPRMLVTVDIVIFLKTNSLKILLIKRAHDPFKGDFALPGGYPNHKEPLLDAAKRELFEETGLQGIELTQLGVFDSINRDPRDRTISIAYYGTTDHSNSKISAGDDASEAEWFPITSLPKLAFDHSNIIDLALGKIN
jgi:8-oxo-dGTP diphosphatase